MPTLTEGFCPCDCGRTVAAKTCEACGESYYPRHQHVRQQKYCSHRCQNRTIRRNQRARYRRNALEVPEAFGLRTIKDPWRYLAVQILARAIEDATCKPRQTTNSDAVKPTRTQQYEARRWLFTRDAEELALMLDADIEPLRARVLEQVEREAV